MKKYYAWMGALILLWLVLTCVFLILAPDQVPVHFDINGNVDRMGSKFEYLLFPGVGLIAMYGSMYSAKKSAKGNEKTVAISMLCILGFLLVLTSYFMWKALDPATVADGLNRLALRGTMIGLMVLFIVLGNIMPKVQRNGTVGLRTKWSMANDRVWQKSQRFGGFSSVICGIVLILLGVFVKNSPILWMLLILLIWSFSCILSSYVYYRKDCISHKNEQI